MGGTWGEGGREGRERRSLSSSSGGKKIRERTQEREGGGPKTEAGGEGKLLVGRRENGGGMQGGRDLEREVPNCPLLQEVIPPPRDSLSCHGKRARGEEERAPSPSTSYCVKSILFLVEAEGRWHQPVTVGRKKVRPQPPSCLSPPNKESTGNKKLSVA